MYNVTDLKQTRGIKNITLGGGKKINGCRGLLGSVMLIFLVNRKCFSLPTFFEAWDNSNSRLKDEQYQQKNSLKRYKSMKSKFSSILAKVRLIELWTTRLWIKIMAQTAASTTRRRTPPPCSHTQPPPAIATFSRLDRFWPTKALPLSHEIGRWLLLAATPASRFASKLHFSFFHLQ